MFAFVIALVVQIWMAIIQKALTRDPKVKSGVLEVPRAEESTAIPAVFGTVQIAPNAVWWGDVEPVPIKGDRRVFGLVGPRPTLGYRYYAGMQGALCWGPIDELVEIVVAEKYLLSEAGPSSDRVVSGGGYTTTTSDACTPALPIARVDAGQAITISAANLFGGKEVEGGILGTLRFYYGSTTQGENAYLASQPDLAADFPHYKGLCYAVWEHFYFGTSPYLKPWHFVVRRCPTTIGALAGDTTLSRIGDDANPAEIIYEIWTNSRWGLGESSSALDLDSFVTVLETLHTEGLGISGSVRDTAEDTLKEILSTIDGVFTEDPLTGKMRLKLIRADYDVDTLETFTRSNSSQFTTTRADWDKLISEVKVTYTDASARFTTRTRAAYNGAVQQALGKARGASYDYPYVSTAANAEKLGFRLLHAASSPLSAGSLTVSAIGSTLAPGDPFIIDYPDSGLPSTVVRCTRANYGTINGKTTVELEWAEDVFGVPGGVYVGTSNDEWTPTTPTTDGRRFEVDAELVLSSTQGCITLEITGDVTAITLVETQTQKGGEAAGSWTTEDNAAPITRCVDRDDLETGFIAYRISYTDADGSTQTLDDTFPVPPILPPDAIDPGTATGTPGNWSHAFVTEAGGTFVLGAHDPDAESLGTGKYRRVLLPGSFVRGQATVVVKGYVTAYLDCRVSLDDGATWETELLGIRVPLKDLADEIGSKGFKHAVGLAVEVPEAYVGDVLLDAVVVAGDGTTVPEIVNFILESTSAAPPPADGEDEPVTPEIPQSASLLAAWEITETSGETIANKVAGSGGTPALTVGESTGNDTHDPTFQSSPRRFNAVSEGGFTHQLCRYVFSAGEAAALPNGFAIFVPFKVNSGPGDKYIFGIVDGATTGKWANWLYDNTGAKQPEVHLAHTAGGGGTHVVDGVTSVVNGTWMLAGLIWTGSTLKCVTNVEVNAVGSLGSVSAPGTGSYLDFGWPGNNSSFTNGPDDCDFGDMYVWVAAGIDFTGAELAALYLKIRETYTGLPAL